MIRRAILVQVAVLLWLVAFAALLAAGAPAKVGYAHGIGPTMPHPLTPHIGRLYYKPGSDHKARRVAAAATGKTELTEFLANYRKAKQRATCAKHAAGYFMRHGVTTPRPLKGWHGCTKYAMDAAYWRNSVSDALAQAYTLTAIQDKFTTGVESAAHNVVLPW